MKLQTGVGGRKGDGTNKHFLPPTQACRSTGKWTQTNYFVSTRNGIDDEVKLWMCTLISSCSVLSVSLLSHSVSVAHINAHTSKVALVRKLPDDWIQNISCGFKWVSCVQMIEILLIRQCDVTWELLIFRFNRFIGNVELFISGSCHHLWISHQNYCWNRDRLQLGDVAFPSAGHPSHWIYCTTY